MKLVNFSCQGHSDNGRPFDYSIIYIIGSLMVMFTFLNGEHSNPTLGGGIIENDHRVVLESRSLFGRVRGVVEWQGLTNASAILPS